MFDLSLSFSILLSLTLCFAFFVCFTYERMFFWGVCTAVRICLLVCLFGCLIVVVKESQSLAYHSLLSLDSVCLNIT